MNKQDIETRARSRILAVSKQSYPTHEPYMPAGRAIVPLTITSVLVARPGGDYAVYTAISKDTTWTVCNGAKLSFAEACCHFPDGQLDEERYLP